MGDPDLRLLPLLEAVLKDHDPEARPMPMLMVGATDERVPARCLEFGTRCIHGVLLRFDVVDGP